MLRQWLKPATLALGPHGISLRREGGDLVNILTAENAPYSLEQILKYLSENAPALKLARVRFILSAHFARHLILPWQIGLYGMRDWKAFAAYHLHQRYDITVDNWVVRVALQGYGKQVVACAINNVLLAGLQEISAQSKWRVQAIEPALMSIFNHHRRTLKKQDQWLLVAEPQYLLLAEIIGKQWQQFILAKPPAGEESETATAMLTRAIRLSGNAAPVACFGPKSLLPETSSTDIQLQYLPNPEKNSSTSISMLAGL